jgi:hypothetical protein
MGMQNLAGAKRLSLADDFHLDGIKCSNRTELPRHYDFKCVPHSEVNARHEIANFSEMSTRTNRFEGSLFYASQFIIS